MPKNFNISSDDKFYEKPISSEDVFHGKFLYVKSDQVLLSDKTHSTREFIVHPGASAIVAIDDNKNIIMIRQYRYPIKKVFIEIPAGKLNYPNEGGSKELPLDTAKRELAEETGYFAKNWQELGVGHPCIGYSDEVIYYFTASNLELTHPNPDEGEIVETISMSIKEVFLAIENGEITDSKTITGIFLAKLKGII